MIRGAWNANTVAWTLLAALLPTLAILSLEYGLVGLMRLALTAGVVAFWQAVFALTRPVAPTPAAAVTVLAVAVLAPGPVESWQLILALSFGVVLGELVFGGWGRNVFNAGVLTLAFLYFSFPDAAHAAASDWIALAVVPGAVLLMATGILSWRIVVAALTGFTLTAWALDATPVQAPLGSLAFALVFLLGDPVSAAATGPGRLAYGALAGALAALFGAAAYGMASPQSAVFAVLLASAFAPLIDHLAIEFGLRTKTRHG